MNDVSNSEIVAVRRMLTYLELEGQEKTPNLEHIDNMHKTIIEKLDAFKGAVHAYAIEAAATRDAA